MICTGGIQILEQLTGDLAMAVLRSSPSPLNRHINILPDAMHSLAIHAAFPTLSADGTLDLNCTELSLTASTAALNSFAALRCTHRLCIKGVTLRQPIPATGSSATISIGARLISAMEQAVLTCPEEFSIIGAEMSRDQFQVLLDALARNHNLRHLRMTAFNTIAPVFASGLAFLTGLESLVLYDMTFHRRANRHLAPVLRCLTSLTRLQLDHSVRRADVVASFLCTLTNLQSLEICYCAQAERDADALSASIGCLTVLTELTLTERRSQTDSRVAGFSHVLAPSFEFLSGMRRLDLTGCWFYEEGVWLLIPAIRNMPKLEAFSVQVDAVDEATIRLLDALGTTRNCTQLVLYAFYEDSPGTGQLLSQQLRCLPQLKHLRLDFCVVPQLAELSALTHLTLRDSFDGFENDLTAAYSLAAVGRLSSLKYLEIVGAPSDKAQVCCPRPNRGGWGSRK